MRLQPPRPKSDDERILPLINVVFLLLIFFMLAGQLSATDPLEIDPPQSVSEAAVEARELVIVLGSKGELAFDGALIERATLEAAVAERLSGNPAAQVWLKADSGAESLEVIEVMEILSAAGVARLKLLTVPRPDGGSA